MLCGCQDELFLLKKSKAGAKITLLHILLLFAVCGAVIELHTEDISLHVATSNSFVDTMCVYLSIEVNDWGEPERTTH